MVIAPCAAHRLDLLFGDITRHSSVTIATVFSATLSQYWRNRSLPKSPLERIELHEYTAVRQLQRAGMTRWTSAPLVAISLLRTQTATQKAVIYDQFKNIVLLDADRRGRDAAAEEVQLVKSDKMWAELQLYVNLLEPGANALHDGQGDKPGILSVHASFLTLFTHYQSLKYPANPAGAGLKAHCLLVLH